MPAVRFRSESAWSLHAGGSASGGVRGITSAEDDRALTTALVSGDVGAMLYFLGGFSKETTVLGFWSQTPTVRAVSSRIPSRLGNVATEHGGGRRSPHRRRCSYLDLRSVMSPGTP